MDIRQAERIAKENGGILLGYHTIPLPVYQVYFNYKTFDDNPFFPIKKALLQWVHERENGDEGKHVYIPFVSALLGMDTRLVQQVFDGLKKENHIFVDPDTECYRVSDTAIKQFILPDSRPVKEVTGSVILDGKSFDFLPLPAYKPILDDEVNVWSYVRNQDIETHKPIDMSQDSRSADIVRIENALESHKIRLEDMGLKHKEGKNFRVTQVEKKFVSPVYLVYVGKENGKIEKISYIGSTQLYTPAISGTDNFTFSIRRNKKGIIVGANLGYNANEETKNAYIVTTSNDSVMEDLVRSIYKIGEHDHDGIVSKVGNYWQIEITEETLKQSSAPEQIINDCSYTSPLTGESTPHCAIRLNGNRSQGLLILSIKQHIPIYLELNKIIKRNNDLGTLEGKLRAMAHDWRKRLMDMGRYSTLEEIDSYKYIHTLA